MGSYGKWYSPHLSPYEVPYRLHKTLFDRPQPIIRGEDGTPVTAKLVIPPRNPAVSGAVVEYAALVTMTPRPDPRLWGITAVHMKMVMIEEDEEQQKENMEQQDETVMQSVEKVDEDGNMIHRMDRRNNYPDKGNIIPQDALVHPSYGQRIDFQQKTVHPTRYMPARHSKIAAQQKLGAIKEMEISDPDTDKKTVKHEDEDMDMDEEVMVEENKDTYTDIAAAMDANTVWVPIPRDKQVIEDVSSAFGRLDMNMETLYFVFQNVRFPCNPGNYRVLFDVVVDEYWDDQDNRFPPLHLWPMGTYPGDVEEMKRLYGCYSGGYKAGVLEFGYKVNVGCQPQWTQFCAVDYLSEHQNLRIEEIIHTRKFYTEELWHLERGLLAFQGEHQAQSLAQASAHVAGQTEAFAQPIPPTEEEIEDYAQTQTPAYAEAQRHPRIQPYLQPYNIQPQIPAQIQVQNGLRTQVEVQPRVGCQIEFAPVQNQTEFQPHAQCHIQVPQGQNEAEISAFTQSQVYVHNYPTNVQPHVQFHVGRRSQENFSGCEASPSEPYGLGHDNPQCQTKAETSAHTPSQIPAHTQGKIDGDNYPQALQPQVEDYDPARGWARREQYSSGGQSSPSDTEVHDSKTKE